jgi:hypothetical protein
LAGVPVDEKGQIRQSRTSVSAEHARFTEMAVRRKAVQKGKANDTVRLEVKDPTEF